MTWVTALATILGLVSQLVDYLKQRQLIDGAVAETVAANLRSSLDAIEKARVARDAVRDDFDSVRNDPDNRDAKPKG